MPRRPINTFIVKYKYSNNTKSKLTIEEFKTVYRITLKNTIGDKYIYRTFKPNKIDTDIDLIKSIKRFIKHNKYGAINGRLLFVSKQGSLKELYSITK